METDLQSDLPPPLLSSSPVPPHPPRPSRRQSSSQSLVSPSASLLLIPPLLSLTPDSAWWRERELKIGQVQKFSPVGDCLVLYQGALLQKQFVTLVALEPLESGQCQRSAYFDLENLRLRKCGI